MPYKLIFISVYFCLSPCIMEDFSFILQWVDSKSIFDTKNNNSHMVSY